MCETTLLVCRCCGAGVHDTAEENVSHGREPYPQDVGFGMCRRCGGDPNASNLWERMGWSAETFYKTRIALIQDALYGEHRDKFDGWPLEKKIAYVTRLVQRGVIV